MICLYKKILIYLGTIKRSFINIFLSWCYRVSRCLKVSFLRIPVPVKALGRFFPASLSFVYMVIQCCASNFGLYLSAALPVSFVPGYYNCFDFVLFLFCL